jgi:hypothetical protein
MRKMEQYVRVVAGSFVLISLLLGYLHSPYWQIWTAFVGLNLLQSGLTKWCLLENILVKFGVPQT